VMHNTEQLSQDGLLKNTLKKPLTPKRDESQGSSPQINLLMKDIIALCNRDKEDNGIEND